MGDAMREVGGTVQWINMPTIIRCACRRGKVAALFSGNAVFRESATQAFNDQGFTGTIRFGNEIDWPFVVDAVLCAIFRGVTEQNTSAAGQILGNRQRCSEIEGHKLTPEIDVRSDGGV